MGSHNSTAQGERMLARGGRKLAQSEPVEPSARGLSRGTLLCQLQRAYQEFLGDMDRNGHHYFWSSDHRVDSDATSRSGLAVPIWVQRTTITSYQL